MTIRFPVALFRDVTQARIAIATSIGSITRFRGVSDAARCRAARSRPTTKSVSTAAGDTHRKRTSGPNTRARDIVIVSSAAFAAQYAMLLPDPVDAEMDETLTTTASPDARSSGSIARITE